MKPLLAFKGIEKSFPGVRVLKGVSFDVRLGEVHALVGENGAGKSTLMNILAGVHRPDAGTISFEDKEAVIISDEKAAQELGIAIVFQERSLFPTLSVAENIYAARQPVGRFGRIDRRKLHSDARALLGRVGMDEIHPAERSDGLSPAQQQMVEIAKALSLNAKLLILDEPTAALTETETKTLFLVIQQLRGEGVGVIYISHRLEEIFQIADRVTVLKDGEWQGTFPTSQTTLDELVRRMVGRDLALHERRVDTIETDAAPVALEVRGLTDSNIFKNSRPYLRDIAFSVRSGEIVAFAGLAGAGRTELALSLFGVRNRLSGEVLIRGKRIAARSPAEAIAAGLGYVPEDRKEAGLFLDMNIAQNIVAGRLDLFGSWHLDDQRVEEVSERFGRQLRLTCSGPRQIVRTLSGGNQQKVVLAKWLLMDPTILIGTNRRAASTSALNGSTPVAV
ncbi:MAG: sugar ABC transporter ATP-binding protein [Pyrinomonadaceae bacterium]